MPAVLLTWNPPKDPTFPDRMKENDGHTTDPCTWRCRMKRGVAPGRRAFMCKQGRGARGIVASGIVVTRPWTSSGTTWIEITFESFLNDVETDSPLPRDVLRKNFPRVSWDSQFSGVPIPDDVAEEVQSLWERHLTSQIVADRHRRGGSGFFGRDRVDDELLPPDDNLLPPRRRQHTTSTPVRDSKRVVDLKALYDCTCQVCKYRVYCPKSGQGFANVHHMRPLGKNHAGLDNWNNMIVLCPTCHAEFELFTLAVNPADNRICVNPSCRNHPQENQYVAFLQPHRLSEENHWYHWEKFREAR